MEGLSQSILLRGRSLSRLPDTFYYWKVLWRVAHRRPCKRVPVFCGRVFQGQATADFADRTAAIAREVLRQDPVSAVSCAGVGSGSRRWSEEELQRLELGVVGAFARGCHNAGIAQFCLLSAAGSTARSRFRYARVMGMKEDTVRKIGFTRLAIFRPGIIVGNAHTPARVGWLGRLVPGPFGNIDQRILGRSIAAEIALHSPE
jgi:hypothetical protein